MHTTVTGELCGLAGSIGVLREYSFAARVVKGSRQMANRWLALRLDISRVDSAEMEYEMVGMKNPCGRKTSAQREKLVVGGFGACKVLLLSYRDSSRDEENSGEVSALDSTPGFRIAPSITDQDLNVDLIATRARNNNM